ncbi:complex I NDUFA9 subunit family protein [Pelagibius sp.]|uniref:complex I NDUFA9 subunit family protein n=1 Tax=Pelagibius sp. TaxID=1931238 RepID=UPI00261B8BD7|nr:complex I NDUFA9 subunit family protein [Pelagibius sp.]
MASQQRPGQVTVFGGSGFLGREIVRHLVAESIPVRAAARRPERVGVPGAEAVRADLRDADSVAAALQGADAAVNAVGLYIEQGDETFAAIHEEGARTVAQRCAAQGVARLVQISGIGADLNSPAAYVRSRAKGEALVLDVFPKATILRPSALFGPGDSFVTALAGVIRRSPVVPLFGSGATRLQPVFVGDVAAAVGAALRHPAAPGAAYDLGGPRTYSYRALLELVAARIGRRPRLLPLPFPVWQGLATLATVLPRPPITAAQVALMRQDNVVADDALTLADLGVEATALEAVLPSYTI